MKILTWKMDLKGKTEVYSLLFPPESIQPKNELLFTLTVIHRHFWLAKKSKLQIQLHKITTNSINIQITTEKLEETVNKRQKIEI